MHCTQEEEEEEENSEKDRFMTLTLSMDVLAISGSAKDGSTRRTSMIGLAISPRNKKLTAYMCLYS